MIFNISKDFSKNPSARTEEEGPNSGVKLRELLTPLVKDALSREEDIVIILDGTNGLGTSFLEEVFGGFIREEKIAYELLKKHLKIVSDEEPDLVDEVWQYINDARQNG